MSEKTNLNQRILEIIDKAIDSNEQILELIEGIQTSLKIEEVFKTEREESLQTEKEELMPLLKFTYKTNLEILKKQVSYFSLKIDDISSLLKEKIK